VQDLPPAYRYPNKLRHQITHRSAKDYNKNGVKINCSAEDPEIDLVSFGKWVYKLGTKGKC
jgi:hypothetical protein